MSQEGPGEEEEEEGWEEEEEEEAGEEEAGGGEEEEEEGAEKKEEKKEEGEEGEEEEPRKLTEEEEIALLESEGWVNTSKIRGPPARMAPKPPPQADKIAAGKKETWDSVRSERDWSQDVDLHTSDSPLVQPKKPHREEIALPASVTDVYSVGEKIADGPFASVYQAEHKEKKKTVALKVQAGARVAELVAISKEVSGESLHLSLVQDAFLWDDDSKCALALAFRAGGRLLPHLQQHEPSEARVAAILRDILDALRAVHAKGIVHLDVIPENILCTTDSASCGVVLEGLSLARRAATTAEPQSVPISGGSVPFQAPEVIFNAGFNQSADMWSVGVIAFLLLTGELPFPETHAVRLKVSIKKGVFQIPDFVSTPAQELIKALLAVDPAARPSAEAVLAMPFFKEASAEKIVPDFGAKMGAFVKK